jgi:hypothetical protein
MSHHHYDKSMITTSNSMPPPSGENNQLICNNNKSKKYKKQILDEETYIESLCKVIEKTYFPETAKLKNQLDLLEAYELEDHNKIKIINDKILKEVIDKNNMNNQLHIETNPLNNDINQLSVDNFLNKYTSEDNNSFEELHEKDIQLKRKQLHWAYDGESDKKAGMLMLYHIGDKVLTVEERRIMDSICDGHKSIGDDRQNAPDSWKFRVRNQLMFPPELIDSQDICNMKLDNNNNNNNNNKLIQNKWINNDNLILEPKIIQTHNTRINEDNTTTTTSKIRELGSSTPLEDPHTPSIFSSDVSSWESSSEVGGGRQNNYKFVELTPSPMPGSLGYSPIMTYGEICGTPAHIDNDATINTTTNNSNSLNNIITQFQGISKGHTSDSNQFNIKPIPLREDIAHKLDIKNKDKVKKKINVQSNNKIINNSRLTKLTPAGLKLSERIHNNTNNNESWFNSTPISNSIESKLNYSSFSKKKRNHNFQTSNTNKKIITDNLLKI